MVFTEIDKNNNEWILLFRSYAGNGKKISESLPETSKDEWIKGDTNVSEEGQGFFGGMKEEPTSLDWFNYCNRKQMELNMSDKIQYGRPPTNGNQLLDSKWKMNAQGVLPPDVDLSPEGNFWPNINIIGNNGRTESDTPTSSKYSYPSVSYPIIWRSVTPGSKSSPTFRDVPEWAHNIYYKRLTPWNGMDIKELFLTNFGYFGVGIKDTKSKIPNVPDIDFELYSTLEDALATDNKDSWWDEMSNAEKEFFLKPKNPKRWKIYSQANEFDGQKKNTLFGEKDLAFPSFLGPNLGNTNKPGSNGKSSDDDDIKRQASTGKALEEASLDKRFNAEYPSDITNSEGKSEYIQASEWKYYVLGKELGCVLDYDSQKSYGSPLVNTAYVNVSNIKDHLKCSSKLPVCEGYKPWSGQFDYDLSTIHASGPGQIWGKCRGISKEEKDEIKKKALLETTAQRMVDMQDLKVKPYEHIRDPTTMTDITGKSEAARQREIANKISILSIDSKDEEDGVFFNFDIENLDTILEDEVKNESTIEVEHMRRNEMIGTFKVVIYRNSNGGSTGNARGKLEENAESGNWQIGDYIIPKNENKDTGGSTQGLGGALEDTRFAQAAFKNLKSRYEQKLGQLQDQDKVLRLQMEEIKKKADKLGGSIYKLNKETKQLERDERSITLSQEYDQSRIINYNLLTSIAGIISIIILFYIVKNVVK